MPPHMSYRPYLSYMSYLKTATLVTSHHHLALLFAAGAIDVPRVDCFGELPV
jgi:hypothetical protein